MPATPFFSPFTQQIVIPAETDICDKMLWYQGADGSIVAGVLPSILVTLNLCEVILYSTNGQAESVAVAQLR